MKRNLPNILTRYAVLSLLATGLVAAAWWSHARAAEDTPPERNAATTLPEPKDPASRVKERQALIAFYQALGGPDWIQRDFWGSDRPVGEWHGVTTDADGFVVVLTVYDNNVTGTLPAAICGLQRLYTLHLSFNNLSGSLPDGLGQCRALKNLWLKGNQIGGRLPDSVALLPALEYLDIHANKFSGPLPTIWNTPKLQIFRADNNRISGPLPAQLLSQPALEQVYILNNQLSGPIPATPSANFTSLLLSNNALTGPIPESMGRLKKLTDLRLNRNRLTGTIPASFAEPSALQVLRLDHNRLSGKVPPGLAERLSVFDVSDNPDMKQTR